MDERLEIYYQWLREHPHKETDTKPHNLGWRLLMIIRDLDRKVKELEARANSNG